MRKDRRTLLRRSVMLATAALFSRGAASLAGPAPAGVAGFAGRSPVEPRAAAADALADTFMNRTSAAAVGRSDLRLRPAEADLEALIRLIGIDAGKDRPDLKSAVRARVREDFDQGRVVALDGAILSETELRLCALAALRS
jgi:hypothetical protein